MIRGEVGVEGEDDRLQIGAPQRLLARHNCNICNTKKTSHVMHASTSISCLAPGPCPFPIPTKQKMNR